MEAFLNDLSLVGSSIITEHETDQQENQETLTLTTIHQAKGLESFPDFGTLCTNETVLRAQLLP